MQLPRGVESKFQYVMLIAKRAEQIIEGSMPKTRMRHTKPARVAMYEVDRGLVDFRIGDEILADTDTEIEA